MTQSSSVTTWYVSSAKYANAPIWQPSTAYTVGQIVRQQGRSINPTISVASPCVVTWKDLAGATANHNLVSGDLVSFHAEVGGALPTGITDGQWYYVISTGLTASDFRFAATYGGAAINTSGSVTNPVTVNAIKGGTERCFMCITAGTSLTTEPAWTLDKSAPTTEAGGPVWVEVTGYAAANGDLANTPNWTNGGKPGYQNYGQIIKDDAGTSLFICKTNNQAPGASEPTWNTAAIGNVTTDGSQQWVYIGTSMPAWGAPHASIPACVSKINSYGSNSLARKVYVGNSHNYQASGGTSLNWPNNVGANANPVQYLCVNEAGSMPPAAGDLATGATEIFVGGGAFYTTLLAGWGVAYGITWAIGAAAGSFGYGMNPGSQNGASYFEKCSFHLLNTASASIGAQGDCEWKNCSVKFAAADQKLGFSTARFFWHNDDGTPGLVSGSAVPTQLFGAGYALALVRGVDLSAVTTGLISYNNSGNAADVTFQNCKLAANVKAITQANLNYYAAIARVKLIDCDSDASYNRNESYDYAGITLTDRIAYRSGGALLGSAFSWKMNTASQCGLSSLCASLPFSAYNDTTAANVTVTVYGCVNAIALPTNADLYMDVSYHGESGSPLAYAYSTRAPWNSSPVNLTADNTSDWAAGAPARQNSHAYVVGDPISLPSNANRLFICITAGTSAGNEPSGYATAVDGDSVTDGAAVFRAVCRFSMAVTLASPQPAAAGPIHVTVNGAKASQTYWIDPVANLS